MHNPFDNSDWNNGQSNPENRNPQPEQTQSYEQTHTQEQTTAYGQQAGFEQAQGYTTPISSEQAQGYAQTPQQYSSVYPAYTPAYSSYSYQSVSPAIRKKSKKKFGRKKFAAVLCAVCMFGSAAFGFGGVYFATYLSTGSVTGGTGNNTAVLYQSVGKDTGNGSASGDMSVAQVAAAVKDSVVEITTEVVSRNGRMGQLVSTGAGSGVILSEDGYVVTNNHVIDGASSITVRLADASEWEAVLVGTDAKTDLAILKINVSGLKPVVLGNSGALLVGETAIAVGNPLGELGGTVTEGIISALDREITIDGESMSLLQTSAAINPGNSGGGLFNLDGELVGIVNAKSSGSDIEGLGFAIPVSTAKNVVEDLIKNGYVTGRVDTGLTLVDIQDITTAMRYRVNALGLYIAESKTAQFRSGDLMQAINGETVKDLTAYNKLMEQFKVGDTIQITVLRSSNIVTESIVLGEQTE